MIEKQMFACDACHYLFQSECDHIEQCPDCGKYRVRKANKAEIEEFISRLEEDEESILPSEK